MVGDIRIELERRTHVAVVRVCRGGSSIVGSGRLLDTGSSTGGARCSSAARASCRRRRRRTTVPRGYPCGRTSRPSRASTPPTSYASTGRSPRASIAASGHRSALREPALLLLVADREPVLDEDGCHPRRAAVRRSASAGGTGSTRRPCRTRARARCRRGCTSCGRTARSRRPRAAAPRTAGSTTVRSDARSGFGQRDVTGDPGVHVLRHPFDRAALACGVASLEHHHEAHRPWTRHHSSIFTSS